MQYSAIYDYLNKIKDEKNGLCTIDLPTGYGKTYQSLKFIADYVESGGKRKIFFLTSNKNNVNESYKDYTEKLKGKNAIKLETNLEYFKSYILQNGIKKKDFNTKDKNQEKNIDAINKTIKDINALKDKNVYDSALSELESNFRYNISNYCEKEKINSIDKLKKRFPLIGQMYKGLDITTYQVCFCTISKFVSKFNFFYEPSCELIFHKISKDAIIIIDEFDATKDSIENIIISHSLQTKFDYKEFLKNLHNGLLNKEQYPTSIKYALSEHDKSNPAFTFDKFTKWVDKNTEKFKVKSCFDYKDDIKNDYLFRDYSRFHSMINSDKNYTIKYDEQQNKYIINLTNNKDEKSEIFIPSMLKNIHKIITSLTQLVLEMSGHYAKYLKDNHTEEIPKNNIYSSILKRFELGDSKSFLSYIIQGTHFSKLSKDEIIRIPSFYEDGFEFVSLRKTAADNDNLIFELTGVNSSPEQYIQTMAKKSLVIGLSATANIPSVLCNYDMDYLKNELKDRFLNLSDEFLDKKQQELDELNKSFYGSEINVFLLDNNNTNSLENKLNNDELMQFINNKLKFIDTQFASDKEKADNKIKYYKNIYKNIFECMYSFISNDNIRSFLYLGMAGVGDDKILKESPIREVFETLVKFVNKDINDYHLIVLDASNFKAKKDEYLELLKDKKNNVFIMSAYATAGVGHNLQFKEYKEDEDDEEVYKDDFKDIESAYFGDITQLFIHDNSDVNDEELLKNIIKIKRLENTAEISSKEAYKHIKYSFEMFLGSKNSSKKGSLQDTFSARLFRARVLLQAIGRLNRTDNKAKQIDIFIDKNLAQKCDCNWYLSSNNQNPLATKIMQELKKHEKPTKDLSFNIINKKLKDSNIFVDNFFNTYNAWTKRKQMQYKFIRHLLLKYPSLSKDDIKHINSNSEYLKDIMSLYIPNNEKNSYGVEQYEYADKKDTVGINSTILKELFKYDGFKEYFFKKYSDDFSKEFILPIGFFDTYKGFLGEVFAEFVLNNELEQKLQEIEKIEEFEKFDFIIQDGVYLDVKSWHGDFVEAEYNKIRNKVKDKKDFINAKKVVVLNILGDEICNDYGDILAISPLAKEENNKLVTNKETIKKIISWINHE